MNIENNLEWDDLCETYEFTSAYKVIQQKGNLVYEYNPFRNYRLNQPKFEYQGKDYTFQELLDMGFKVGSITTADDFVKALTENGNITWTKNGITLNVSESPIYKAKNSLTDFDTDELKFSLNNPVNITSQWSYDGSVNLILNDGLNKPRLINSRFSPIGRNRYQIVDRKGDNDTNIYDQGEQFDVDTSLYKVTNLIPKLTYYGTLSAGNLSIGNYHFYFKYMDADGNETDFIAESGLVSVFIGNEPYNIYTGFRNQNSHKGVQFLLQNLDSGYQYLSVYYTINTSDISQNATTTAYKLDQRYVITTANYCSVKITGYEETTEIPLTDINPQYHLADNVQTQDSCQNRLFFGNITIPEVKYIELSDLSLRFRPKVRTESYNTSVVDVDYTMKGTLTDTYYNSKFIYNKTGYWPNELYRFGIVYIMSNNSLSPVFNVRGMDLTNDNKYSEASVYKNDDRYYISYNEETYLITNDTSKITLENVKGVVRLNPTASSSFDIYSLIFECEDAKTVLSELQKMGIKGFFFVRQKRMPTILCQAFIIGADKESRVPAIPYGARSYVLESFLNQGNNKTYYTLASTKKKVEKDSDAKVLSHDYTEHVITIDKSYTNRCAICPDYDINSPYYNSLFNGDTFVIKQATTIPEMSNGLTRLYYEDRYYYAETYTKGEDIQESAQIQGVEDNTKLVAVGNIFFSARAGEAEEAFRYEYAQYENKTTDATNLIRGSYGPFLAMSDGSLKNTVVDIMIPNYSNSSMSDYFDIRFQDNSAYYAISDRLELNIIAPNNEDTTELGPYYRGDCYIGQFTHRVNRNFQDPSAPVNDKIVDKNCWKDNYEISDEVLKVDNFENINLGDVNAVQLGQWITFTLRSNYNLNVRSIDDSIPDEMALTGHPRTFIPYGPISVSGIYKVPEALCINQGFSKGLSERWNFLQADVPAIKNNYSTRILYSDIYVTDAFKNGFRVFQGTHYRDYPMTYGSITKIVELRGNLICVFEHGVALIAVNERTLSGEGSGGNVYVNTSNVLPENPKVISDKFGSQWRESIIKTPQAIYGVDTVGKKIWRTNGNNFECISDFKIQEFLNNNISLTERELDPVIGVRNVKTHYNAFKHDVMFTFYDNLYGFEERVWNLCYNELQQKWITFYSWVPSYSENIYNQYFSFDRNTSKWITKLGISHADNDFSDGVVLSENVIPNSAKAGDIVGKLSLANRTLPSGTGITVDVNYELVRDIYQNYKKFEIQKQSDGYYLVLKVDATDLCSEMYVRGTKSSTDAGKYEEKITDPSTQKEDWIENCVLNSNYCACKNERGIRITLDTPLNSSTLVTLLNIRAHINVAYESDTPTDLEEAYITGQTNTTYVDAGYYESVIAVIPKYNIQFLTTDFWKHGQAGIIDIADPVAPTYWYGKQHPFEFEFVVADNPQLHKIFDDLEIISNNAEPESFHYEVIGDCFDFAKDKKNMYIRQEATKELYQYNGYDIVYDHDYTDLNEEHRPYSDSNGKKDYTHYDKSTILPLWYSRQDSINEIEDYYHLKDGGNTKDFSAMAGGEIVRYKNLDEFRIWNHADAVDVKGDGGRMRGNMQYKEDKWNVQINPINLVQRNEPAWDSVDLLSTLSGRKTISSSKIPIELGQNPIPDGNQNISFTDASDIPDNSQNRAVVTWKWDETNNSKTRHSEAKVKDKWVKIRIRYKGNKLAIITAIRTLYSASYA